MTQVVDIKGQNFGGDGSVKAVDLPTEAYESALYLCTDQGTDFGVEGGWATIEKSFKFSRHCPFDVDQPHISDCGFPDRSPFGAIKFYKQMEEALEEMPKPTYVLCKSGSRATAFLAIYKAIKMGHNLETTLELSSGLSFLPKAGLKNFVTTVVSNLSQQNSNPLMFRQLFEITSSTYTYLLADTTSKEALLIDPVLETVERDSKLVSELGFTLKYVANTHVHADHITGSGKLKELHPGCKSVLSIRNVEAKADMKVAEYDYLELGNRKLFVLATPGHTSGCISFVLDDLSKVFTGDTMLIRGCGRTDFQGGSASTLYHSVHSRLFTLPAACSVFPAHDYKGQTCSTIAEERSLNPRLTKDEKGFIEIMDNLNLPYPKKIDEAMPANLECGIF